MTCSLVNQTFSIPCTLFYSFSPDVQFESLIRVQPPTTVLLDIQHGQFNDVIITFFDQNLNPVTIKDSNTVILLQFTLNFLELEERAVMQIYCPRRNAALQIRRGQVMSGKQRRQGGSLPIRVKPGPRVMPTLDRVRPISLILVYHG